MDNNITTISSNFLRSYTPEQITRFSPKHYKKNQIQRFKNTKTHIDELDGVDLSGNTVVAYEININGKEWWWPHFAN